VTLREGMYQFGEAIAGDYAKSWSIGAWFVASFALVGCAAQAWLSLTSEQALVIALAAATPVAFGRALRVCGVRFGFADVDNPVRSTQLHPSDTKASDGVGRGFVGVYADNGSTAGRAWRVAHVLAQLAIAAVGLFFTVSYNRVNSDLQRVQVQTSLIPLLTSADPNQRQLALALARRMNEQFAAQAASLLAVQDRSPEVRLSAAAELNSLAQGAPGGAREIAREGLNRARILEELRRKHLLEKLREASGYLGAQSVAGTGSAISLYLSVWKDLSESARRNLDPSLLRKAESALKYGAMETAARSYQAMFEPFLAAPAMEETAGQQRK